MIITGDNNPDIEWSVAHMDGVSILCLQAAGPTMSAGMACTEIETLQFHGVTDLRESTVALFNGHPGDGAKVLLETPYDPLLQPVLDAAENGELWVFCLQYMSQGTHLTRFWYVEGSQPSDDTLIDHWIVRIV